MSKVKENSALFLAKYNALDAAYEILSEKIAKLKEQQEKIHKERWVTMDKYKSLLIGELVSRDFKEGQLYWSKKRQFDVGAKIIIKIIGLCNTTGAFGERALVVSKVGFCEKSPHYSSGYVMEKEMILPDTISKDYEPSTEEEFVKMKKFLYKNLEDPTTERWIIQLNR